jgi:hypothetical protein
MPERSGLKGTDLEPDYFPTGLFKQFLQGGRHLAITDPDAVAEIHGPGS